MIRVGPVVLACLLLTSGLLLCGCGSGSTGRPSNVSKRALVSNDFDNTLHIINAQLDVETAANIGGFTRPHTMVLSPDKTLTLVFSFGSNALSVVTNAKETVAGTVSLPGFSESFLMLSDNKTGYAAVRSSGLVDVLDLSGFTITSTLSIPQAHWIASSPDGKKLLVFSDNSDSITIIDTTNSTASSPIGGFSRPVWTVFSSDNSKAFVMNCGPECGGTLPAGVAVLNMSVSPPTIVANIPVPAATYGLLNGSTLYVVGSPPGMACSGGTAATTCGVFSVIDSGNNTVTGSGVITDGYHYLMQLGNNGQIFIGARTCTNVCPTCTITNGTEVRGCLSILNTSANNQVTIPAKNGDVTGITPIANRNVMYVVQGGELATYDTTTGSLLPPNHQIDITGQAWDVKDVE